MNQQSKLIDMYWSFLEMHYFNKQYALLDINQCAFIVKYWRTIIGNEAKSDTPLHEFKIKHRLKLKLIQFDKVTNYE